VYVWMFAMVVKLDGVKYVQWSNGLIDDITIKLAV